jgi:hypothetical protein
MHKPSFVDFILDFRNCYSQSVVFLLDLPASIDLWNEIYILSTVLDFRKHFLSVNTNSGCGPSPRKEQWCVSISYPKVCVVQILKISTHFIRGSVLAEARKFFATFCSSRSCLVYNHCREMCAFWPTSRKK